MKNEKFNYENNEETKYSTENEGKYVKVKKELVSKGNSFADLDDKDNLDTDLDFADQVDPAIVMSEVLLDNYGLAGEVEKTSKFELEKGDVYMTIFNNIETGNKELLLYNPGKDKLIKFNFDKKYETAQQVGDKLFILFEDGNIFSFSIFVNDKGEPNLSDDGKYVGSIGKGFDANDITDMGEMFYDKLVYIKDNNGKGEIMKLGVGQKIISKDDINIIPGLGDIVDVKDINVIQVGGQLFITGIGVNKEDGKVNIYADSIYKVYPESNLPKKSDQIMVNMGNSYWVLSKVAGFDINKEDTVNDVKLISDKGKIVVTVSSGYVYEYNYLNGNVYRYNPADEEIADYTEYKNKINDLYKHIDKYVGYTTKEDSKVGFDFKENKVTNIPNLNIIMQKGQEVKVSFELGDIAELLGKNQNELKLYIKGADGKMKELDYGNTYKFTEKGQSEIYLEDEKSGEKIHLITVDVTVEKE